MDIKVPELEFTIMTFPNFSQGDSPGGPVVKTSPSNAGGMGSIPGQEAEISHASWPKNQKHRIEAVF